MCFGGGGNEATQAAEQREREREQQIKNATAAIDHAFTGRQSQYDDFVGALREQFRTEAEREKGVADRRLKFGLARGGLTGGSAAADAGTTLSREFQQGLLRGEGQAQSSLADLIGADERTRSNLISLAQGGAGVSTAAQQAAAGLRSNLAGARAEGSVAGIGDIFSKTRGLYTAKEEAAERRRGLRESDVYADPFSRGS